MASQAECDPDEFRFFQLPADSSRRQTVPELSGSPCLICRNRDSGAVDWPAEIEETAGLLRNGSGQEAGSEK